MTNIGNELYKCGKELIQGTTFKRFNQISSEKKAVVLLKTAMVAFAAGILVHAVLWAPVITAVVSGVSGAMALAYFTRSIPGAKIIFDATHAVDQVLENPAKAAEKLGGKIENKVKKAGSTINNALDSFIDWAES